MATAGSSSTCAWELAGLGDSPVHRRFYGDAVTGAPLLWLPPPGACTAGGGCAPEPRHHGGAVRMLAVPAAALDGGGQAQGQASAAAAGSVARCLEEWYPTKAGFKQHLRAYAEALLQLDQATATAAEAGDPKQRFKELQLLGKHAMRDFYNFRFYRAAAPEPEGTGEGEGEAGGHGDGGAVGMPVLRCDVSAAEVEAGGSCGLCGGCGGCDLAAGTIAAALRQCGPAGEGADRRVALLHFWEGGLAAARDPRDRQYALEDAALVRMVGEGHPSEVHEASTSPVPSAATATATTHVHAHTRTRAHTYSRAPPAHTYSRAPPAHTYSRAPPAHTYSRTRAHTYSRAHTRSQQRQCHDCCGCCDRGHLSCP